MGRDPRREYEAQRLGYKLDDNLWIISQNSKTLVLIIRYKEKAKEEIA